MLQELVLVLAVVSIIGWMLYKVVEGIHEIAQSAFKQLTGSFALLRNRRFLQKRSIQLDHINFALPDELKKAEQTLQTAEAVFAKRRHESIWVPTRPHWEKLTFRHHAFASQGAESREFDIADIDSILCPDAQAWAEKEHYLIFQQCSYPMSLSNIKRLEFNEFALPTLSLEPAVFKVDSSIIRDKDVARFWVKERNAAAAYNLERNALLSRHMILADSVSAWNSAEKVHWSQYNEKCDAFAEEEAVQFRKFRSKFEADCRSQKIELSQMLDGFRNLVKPLLLKRVNCILSSITLPSSIPRFWAIDYDEQEQILVVEIALPDIVHHTVIKTIVQKSGKVKKPLNQTERRELLPRVHPALILRVAHEILRNNIPGVIKLLALNGWVSFTDPHTGLGTRAYTASILVTAEQLSSINLKKVDPLAAFLNLKGKSAGKLIDIIPIEPTLKLKKTDSRFIDARSVLDSLVEEVNLAAMDWQDFEHLIRELFEKEFADRGAEVKITQTSRDRGVDAIAFNPDPIQGGKYIIQAKRYTNTVDVSAVRDLCAVVRKEGASRGILVTTSTYGADAYEFANNEPITLLNGAELLGLLQKHGYNFRINLVEARRATANRRVV